jgi:hypothetical protein
VALRLLLAMVAQPPQEPSKNAAREAGLIPRLHALISAPLPPEADGHGATLGRVPAAECVGARRDALALLEGLTTDSAANCAAVRSVEGPAGASAAPRFGPRPSPPRRAR